MCDVIADNALVMKNRRKGVSVLGGVGSTVKRASSWIRSFGHTLDLGKSEATN